MAKQKHDQGKKKKDFQAKIKTDGRPVVVHEHVETYTPNGKPVIRRQVIPLR